MLRVKHDPEAKDKGQPLVLPKSHAEDAGALRTIEADLRLSPDQDILLSITDTPRQTGLVRIDKVVFTTTTNIACECLRFPPNPQWVHQGHVAFQQFSPHTLRQEIEILPKPPKVRLDLLDPRRPLYIGETADFEIIIHNDEEEDAQVQVDARLISSLSGARILDFEHTNSEEHEPSPNLADSSVHGKGLEVGLIARNSRARCRISLQTCAEPAELQLQLQAQYTIPSDHPTPIVTEETISLTVTSPFDVTSHYTPLLMRAPWPNYFDCQDDEKGLCQKWLLTTRISSLIEEDIYIEHTHIQNPFPSETASLAIMSNDSKPGIVRAAQLQEVSVIVHAQKDQLDDRRSTQFQLQLVIKWKRAGLSDTTTLLPLSALTVNFGEPRVLAYVTTAHDAMLKEDLLVLEYVVENPSNYTLTFDVSMATSDEFAFAGTKHFSVRLLPLTRHTVHYRLLPLIRGSWINPQLRVYDTQFHKTLKVHGTEGVRDDRHGLSVWVDAED